MLELDGPGMRAVVGTRRTQTVSTVRGGTLTLETSTPIPRVRLELRYAPYATFYFPAVAACALSISDIPVAGRMLMLAMLAGMTWANCEMARAQYAQWIAEGGRRAGGGAGRP
jgi:hypothetical protein